MRHRGPDDDGWTAWDGAGLTHGRGVPPAPSSVSFAHRRLSIIDLSAGGHQPMATEDGRYCLTYNGEIYNYLELRAELERSGVSFRSESDTEVLLRAWAAWGPDCARRLVGMFAFAVLDTHEGTVHLVRDHFGIKPLHYSLCGGLVFASEIPTVLCHPSVSRMVNPERLYDYLRWGLSDHDDQTMFAAVRSLPAASMLTYDVRRSCVVDVRCYWSLEREVIERPFDVAVAGLRDRFIESVRLHLRSDVPVGTALSGGIDSSAITCAARLLAGPHADLHCFGYVAEDERYDERRWIHLAAETAGAHLHEVRLGSTNLIDDLDVLVRSQGEPFGSTSILAQRHVFGAAADAGVTVLLDGQGADELFAGYRSYLAAQFVSLVRAGKVGAAARLARGVTKMPGTQVDVRTAARVLAGVLPPSLRGPLHRLAGRRPFPSWLNRDWFEERSVDGVDSIGGRAGALEQVLESAFSTTSLPALLRYEDRNSMAWSRESRVPFLEPALVEYVFTLPMDHLVGEDGTSKLVFREAMRGIVPDAILDRRDKIGFNTPEDVWLKAETDFVVQRLQGASDLPFLDAPECIREWKRISSGRARFDWRVWRWLNTISWMEAFDVVA